MPATTSAALPRHNSLSSVHGGKKVHGLKSEFDMLVLGVIFSIMPEYLA
ncbi:hypothetical protein APHNP_0106 [Anaplasma phagocytophilum str. ApNP]|uniref:Uncharacterized protein n=2 Tax=Anaplasma phagocytophilum TaxID=948 RepID=A0A0F3NFL8_ANAPH|nr:hypothetical protein APHMUC_0339 [Anaplasma phagocytophilum str. ApMUC09]KJV66835.1 hypothetical protein APHNP_0106 [Anaplasma phagocytophilum str. ApNP]